MSVIYVGPTSAGSANGTSWANRYGTLNSAEDKPVVAGDTVYVGPGVYRELLTIDVSGSSGSPITYIADVSGANTDGIGGIVRITGSDNDTTATRANCITATSKNYRTFRGFTFDTTTAFPISLITACGNWIIEDCYFSPLGASTNQISMAGTGTTNVIRRCIFVGGRQPQLLITHSAAVDNSAHAVENCLFFGNGVEKAIRIDRVGGISIKHCTILGCAAGIRVQTALTTGQTTTVNNCIMTNGLVAFQAATAPATNEEITENYNCIWGNGTDRSNVSTGANSVSYSPLFNPQILLSGFRFPNAPVFGLSDWSPVRRLAGTGMLSEDIYGITRPATDSKKSWGAVQNIQKSRDTATVDTGTGSGKIADAGMLSLFVPVTNVSTTFTARVRWETDYAGTKPQMIIRQPGQSDTTVTATGSSGAWETLTTTLTPAVLPGFVEVLLVSSNTATSGAYAVYVDAIKVT